MIPYSYNMVDMGGIDLAEANGTIVPGLYNKIVEAVNACGDVVLYNWKFVGIEITPQYPSILLGDPITINGAIQVTEQDLVTVPGLHPDPPDPPVLIPIEITENGEYDPSDYEADGFSSVSAEIPIPPAGKFIEIEPDFIGLATAYIGSQYFYSYSDSNTCLFIAQIELGVKYVVFLPENYGNRFRATMFQGKTIDDFTPYLNNPAPATPIYEGTYLFASDSNLDRRYFFTGVDGEVVIQTSNQSQVVEPILLKIQEE